MDKNREISVADCNKLAIKIKDEIYKPAYSFKTTIFLCGADINDENKFRYKVAQGLKNSWRYWFYYDIVYPEDIFDELLYSSKTKDLLSLEGLLAESVDAIVIIPESPGSFAELGAFANDTKLREKIICIVDEKYKKNKSFINQGPIKLIKKANKDGVVYMDPKKYIGDEIEKLIAALKKIKKKGYKKSDKISLLQLDRFILPVVYFLEPVSIDTLINLVSEVIEDKDNSFQTTTTALTILLKKRFIELSPDGYKLTKLGLESFFAFKKTRSRVKSHEEKVKMDKLRLEILNFRNRRKKLKV